MSKEPMNRRHRPLVICILLAALVTPHVVVAQDADFSFVGVPDVVASAAGVSLTITGLLLKANSEPPATEPDYSDLPWIDRASPLQFSAVPDVASDITEYLAFFLPTLLAVGREADELLLLGLMFAEAASLANGTKDMLKAVISRYRPYMYSPSPPAELVEDSDRFMSFPSGHTTMAFTGASFLSFVFATWYPDSKWKVPVVAGSIALAVATATLRVLAGQHFLTDVLAGALIGTAYGIGVPLLHRSRSE